MVGGARVSDSYTDLEIQGAGMTSQRTRDRMAERLQEQGIRHMQVLNVMRRVPRHLFIEEALAHRAYEDTALPIGFGQTISQPWVVARMTEILLECGPVGGRVLEIGTGCGYQTAVLAEFFSQVISVERIQALQKKASVRLQRLGLEHCEVIFADGMSGWPAGAPYSAILAAAAPWGIPEFLLEQLEPTGCLLLPVGKGESQELTLVQWSGQRWESRTLGQVKFVPMLGGLKGA